MLEALQDGGDGVMLYLLSSFIIKIAIAFIDPSAFNLHYPILKNICFQFTLEFSVCWWVGGSPMFNEVDVTLGFGASLW